MIGRLRSFKEDVLEAFLLVKVCLTSFWFWLPVLYASYLFFQIWMIVVIHPLTILIVPTILAVYAVAQEEKHMRIQYKIREEKSKVFLRPFSLMPERSEGFEWNVDKSLEEYKKMTEKEEKNRS